MAKTGFEGFEKRIELRFASGAHPLGLRALPFGSLQTVLDAVQCTIVSAVANRCFDGYVLSESSLFVYPNRLIMKTCGTTQLLRSMPHLLRHAGDMGLTLTACRYTRGGFLFPHAQPFPHTSFRDEVAFLEVNLPHILRYRRASVLPSTSSWPWHVYFASSSSPSSVDAPMMTMEVCMTELDRSLARRFFRGGRQGGDVAGRAMTELAGVDAILPEQSTVCDYAFDPCGYSMNGLVGDRYSTVHVTPEEGQSYGSFECSGGVETWEEVERALGKVVEVFRPGRMSVSVCVEGGGNTRGLRDAAARATWPFGLVVEEGEGECLEVALPGDGAIIMFQTFASASRD